MNEFELRGSDVQVLIWHMATFGLAAILQDAGASDVRLSWTSGMKPRARVSAENLTPDVVGEVVREHARMHVRESSWLLSDIELSGSQRGLMSPRLTPFGAPKVWREVQRRRHSEIDDITESRRWLDLRQVSALGEPSYWSRNRKGEAMQDDGASRFEMQPRNRGSEIVGSRLRKLAQSVSARDAGLVRDGLAGTSTVDEIGSDRADSRTATGFDSPGPTDNAVAWCALWGISQLPTNPRVNGTADSICHLGRARNEWFFMPVWHMWWRPARLRTILTAEQLQDVAATALPSPWGVNPSNSLKGRRWLAARGVHGVVRFKVERFGTDNAPERRAMRGVPLSTEM